MNKGPHPKRPRGRTNPRGNNPRNNGPRGNNPRNNRHGGGQRGKPRNMSRSVMDSNGPEVRVRGTAQQILDKYLALAKDATSIGDRVMAENYFQHADHYYRITLEILAHKAEMDERRAAAQAAAAADEAEQEASENGDDIDDEGDDNDTDEDDNDDADDEDVSDEAEVSRPGDTKAALQAAHDAQTDEDDEALEKVPA